MKVSVLCFIIALFLSITLSHAAQKSLLLEDYLDQLIENHLNTPKISEFLLIKRLMREKKFKLAQQQLFLLPKTQLKGDQGQFLLGKIANHFGDIDQALQLFKNSCDVAVTKMPVCLYYTQQLLDQQRFDDVITMVKRLQLMEGKDYFKKLTTKLLLMAQQNIAQRNQSYQVALDAAHFLVLLYPDDAKLYLNLGHLYLNLDEYESAMDYFEKVVALDRNNREVRLLLARLYEQLSDEAGWKIHIIDLLEFAADSPQGESAKAQAFKKMATALKVEQYDEVIAWCQQLLRVMPWSREVIAPLVFAYRQQQRYEEAAEVWTQYLRLHPQDQQARYELAQLYQAADNIDKAVYHFEQLATYTTDSHDLANIKTALATLYQQQVATVIQQKPSHALPLIEFAQFLYKKGYLIAAQRLATALLTEHPSNHWLRYLLIRISLAKQDYDATLVHVSHVPDNAPLLPELILIKAYLQAMKGDKTALLALLPIVEKNQPVLLAKHWYIRNLTWNIYDNNKLSMYYRYLSMLAVIYSHAAQWDKHRQVNRLLIRINDEKKSLNQGINHAQQNMANANPDQAIEDLAVLTRQHADNAQVAYWLSVALQYNHRWNQALLVLKQAVDKAPHNRKLLLEYARLLAKRTQYKAAKANYQLLLSTTFNAHEQQVYQQKIGFLDGALLQRVADTSAQVALYETMQQVDPQDRLIIQKLINLYESQHQYQAAIKLTKRLATGSFERFDYQLKLMRLSGHLPDDKRWLTFANEAVRLVRQPQQAEQLVVDLINQISLSQTRDDLSRNEAIMQLILEINPDHVDAQINLALFSEKKNNWTKAEHYYLAVLKDDPFDQRVSGLIAKLYVKMGDIEAAMTEFEIIQNNAISDIDKREAASNLVILYQKQAKRLIAAWRRAPNDFGKKNIKGRVEQYLQKKQNKAALIILDYAIEMNNNNANLSYQKGIVLLKMGHRASALKNLARSTLLAPNNESGLMVYGKALLSTDKHFYGEKLLNYVLTTTQRDKWRRDIRQTLVHYYGKKLIEQKKLLAAHQYYENYALHIDDITIKAYLATIKITLGQYNEAQSLLTKLIHQYPNSSVLHLQLAEIYKLTHEKDKWLDELGLALSKDDEGRLAKRVLKVMGIDETQALFDNGRYVEAAQQFAAFLSLNHDAIKKQAYLGIVNIYMAIGQYKKSIKVMEMLVLAAPQDTQLRINIAKLNIKFGNITEAIIELERVIILSHQPDQVAVATANLLNIYQIMATKAEQSAELQAAIDHYQRMIQLDKQNYAANYALGRLYTDHNVLPKQAVKYLEAAIKVKPTAYMAHVYRGIIAEKYEDYSQAIKSYGLAIPAIKPEQVDQVNRISQALRLSTIKQQYRAKDYPWVIQELENYDVMPAAQQDVLKMLSLSYLQTGALHKAASSLQDMTLSTPTNETVRYQLALVYEALNEPELALVQYETINRMGKKTDLLKTTTARSRWLKNKLRNLSLNVAYKIENRQFKSFAASASESSSSVLAPKIDFHFKPYVADKLNFYWYPTYITYRQGNRDEMGQHFGLYWNKTLANGFIKTELSQKNSQGIMFNQRLGSTQAVKWVWGKVLPRRATPAISHTWQPTQVQLFARYSEYTGSSILKNTTQSLEGGLQWAYKQSQSLHLSMEYSINKVNNRRRASRDYAHIAHKADVALRWTGANQLSGVFGVNLTTSAYLFPDSRLRVENQQSDIRKTLQANVYLFASYEIEKRLQMNGGCFVGQQRANMNTGLMYDNAANEIGLQSISLGKYRIRNCEVGMKFQFLD